MTPVRRDRPAKRQSLVATIRVIVERKSELSLGQTIVERRENFAWEGLSQISAVKDAKFGEITDLFVAACNN